MTPSDLARRWCQARQAACGGAVAFRFGRWHWGPTRGVMYRKAARHWLTRARAEGLFT